MFKIEFPCKFLDLQTNRYRLFISLLSPRMYRHVDSLSLQEQVPTGGYILYQHMCANEQRLQLN